jgi:peptidoglycan/LPS O-acetylase OafA/YrhL
VNPAKGQPCQSVKQPSHIAELDGIRGVAALMVMVFHFLQFDIISGGRVLVLAKKLAPLGQTGVSLFFVLSGFLISRILFAAKNRDNYFQGFYLRRALRIWPLYYLFLVLYYFVLSPLDDGKFYSFQNQWPFWIYLQNIVPLFGFQPAGPGHFWSLAIEEQFYLVWPLIVFSCSSRQLYRVIFGSLILALAMRVILLRLGQDPFYFTLTRMDDLAMGAFLALEERRIVADQRQDRIYLVVLALGAVILAPTWLISTGSALPLVQLIKTPAVSLVYVASMALLIGGRSLRVLARLLTQRPLRFVGMIGYGTYVYHPFLFSFYKAHCRIGIAWIDVIGSFFLVLLIATISYYSFESPILRFKRHFPYG